MFPVLDSIVSARDSLDTVAGEWERAALEAKLSGLYARLGLMEDAVTFGVDALEQKPDDLPTSLFVVDAYIRMKRMSAARAVLETALSYHPGDFRLLERKDRIHYP
jgi:hypothetical protein